ncbi:MAG: ABC transporter ATP-binding protein [Pseudomonadota bacterium]
MDLLRLTGIHFAYPQRPPVFQGLDFHLEEGRRVGILGPNGAGKSTLFLLLMGLLRPQQGEVWVLGSPRRQEKDFQEVRTSLGFCFQDPDDQLFSPTVLEDVAFGPLNQGRNKHEVRHLVADTLATLGLAGFEDRVTYHLSGGEKRLVSLATVLAMDPRVLLLDEPTAGLDPDTEARLERVLDQSGKPWAIISHEHDFLRRNCNQLLRLQNGQLVPTS